MSVCEFSIQCRCLGLHLYSVCWFPKHHQSLYNPLTDTCWAAAAYAGSAFLLPLASANGYCHLHGFYQLSVISWTTEVTVQGPFAFTTKDRADCFFYIEHHHHPEGHSQRTRLIPYGQSLYYFLFSLGEGLKLFRRKLWSVDWYLNASWGNCSPSEWHHPRRPFNKIQSNTPSYRNGTGSRHTNKLTGIEWMHIIERWSYCHF